MNKECANINYKYHYDIELLPYILYAPKIQWQSGIKKSKVNIDKDLIEWFKEFVQIHNSYYDIDQAKIFLKQLNIQD